MTTNPSGDDSLLDPPDRKIEQNVSIPIFVVTVLVCITPFLLGLAGVDLGTQGPTVDLVELSERSPAEITDTLFQKLSGSFTHTLLEWSAFCAAVFVGLLSFMHFRLRGDVVTPVIGFALFSAGCVDAFHTLAADRLIEAVAPITDLIPFTWAISRVFVASILVFGSLLVMFYRKDNRKLGFPFFITMSAITGVTAYLIIHYCAVSEKLPKTMFPDSLITRPWDVGPLLMFVVGGLYVFPKLYRSHANAFTFALVVSAIPGIATGLHMAFGSTALFDHHFNAAHFLKMFSYLIPLIGLMLDYVKTYDETKLAQVAAEKATVVAENAREELNERAIELQRTNMDLFNRNKELDEFAYIASHDLKAPLRGIDNLALWIAEDAEELLPEDSKKHLTQLRQRINRLEYLLNDLLAYSRAGHQEARVEEVDTLALVEEIKQLLTESNNFELKIGSAFPIINTSMAPLKQVLMNLVSNAVKHHDREDGKITLTANPNGSFVHFSVEDDGPGIPEEFHEKVFGMFQSLNARDKVEGSGMGLAIVKRMIES